MAKRAWAKRTPLIAAWGFIAILGAGLWVYESRHAADPPSLESILVTGDSTVRVLDQVLAQRLLASGVEVVGDPVDGGTISHYSGIGAFGWVARAQEQIRQSTYGAVVVFVGRNERHAMVRDHKSRRCCKDPGWRLAYKQRVEKIMRTYGCHGRTRVYWLALPAQSGPGRMAIAREVNSAIRAAAESVGDNVRIVRTGPKVSPDGAYSDRLGSTTIYETDRVHLNDAGSNLVAAAVMTELMRDFALDALEGEDRIR